jgi:hypothetical protein
MLAVQPEAVLVGSERPRALTARTAKEFPGLVCPCDGIATATHRLTLPRRPGATPGRRVADCDDGAAGPRPPPPSPYPSCQPSRPASASTPSSRSWRTSRTRRMRWPPLPRRPDPPRQLGRPGSRPDLHPGCLWRVDAPRCAPTSGNSSSKRGNTAPRGNPRAARGSQRRASLPTFPGLPPTGASPSRDGSRVGTAGQTPTTPADEVPGHRGPRIPLGGARPNEAHLGLVDIHPLISKASKGRAQRLHRKRGERARSSPACDLR